MTVLYLYINLIIFLFLVQIPEKSVVFGFPVQLSENPVENDVLFEETDEQDEENEVEIQARIRMFSDQQIDFDGISIKGDIAFSNGLDGRKALSDLSRKWPAGEVPFKFSAEIKNDSLSVIQSAIDDWNNFTCINVRPATDSDSYFVIFQAKYSGCWSFVGKSSFKVQPINLGIGCVFKPTALHEIGHSLGLYHEQSRSDRDATINVLWDNISRGLYPQFNRASDHNFSIGYDVMSVMQYSDWAFSRKMFELNSVATHDPKLQNLLGKAKNLSFRDLKVVNLLYNCSDTCINKNELKCLNEGYISPGKKENGYKCVCVCPPTHEGERCEKRISSDYYEAMNITFCGGLINKTDQIIEQAVNSTPCAWSIKAPENQYIQIEFEKFSMRDKFQSKISNTSEINNRCVYESLELRTENHYDGQRYCENDIKAGDKFQSKENIMILIVHTYSKLETTSNGFKAKIRFLEKTNQTQSDSNNSSIAIENSTLATTEDYKSTTILST